MKIVSIYIGGAFMGRAHFNRATRKLTTASARVLGDTPAKLGNLISRNIELRTPASPGIPTSPITKGKLNSEYVLE